MFLVSPDAGAPADTKIKKPIPECTERVECLLASLHERKVKIIVPTPALAEIMVLCEEDEEQLRSLEGYRPFKIADFTRRAAYKFAEIQSNRLRQSGKGRKQPGRASRAKSKFDDQIMAIAAVNGATEIYSDDNGIKKRAKHYGIRQVTGLQDLPASPQMKISGL